MSTPLELLTDPKKFKEGMNKMKDALKNIKVTGSAGGRMVEIIMNGQFDVLEVHLDPICVDPRDIKMLEDLIKSAYSDGVAKVYSAMHECPTVLFQDFK